MSVQRGIWKSTRQRPAEERFWEKVNADGCCWEWLGARGKHGYGHFGVTHTHIVPVHRFAYETLIGPIPEGMVLDHLCRNPSCVNPDHLEVVTQAENNRRGYSIMGLNARKTHCKFGHPFTSENTAITTRGERHCRICLRANAARWKRALVSDPEQRAKINAQARASYARRRAGGAKR